MPRLAFAFPLSLMLAVLALMSAGCGAGGTGLSTVHRATRLTALAGSGWTERELAVHAVPGPDGAQLTLSSTAAAGTGVLLLELHFDPALAARQVDWTAPEGALSLLVADRPGLLALGVVMPAGEELAPGRLLRCTLVPAAPGARAAAAAPQDKYGAVTDLAATLDSGALRLDWSYRNDGDCDQNSEVNVADLTALASRLRQSTVDGDQDDIDEVLDVDGNTEVNPADLTGIGINYHGTVSAYHVYQADGPDSATAAASEAGSVDFPLAVPNPRTRRRFSLTLDASHLGPGKYYFVRPVGGAGGSPGPASNVVSGDLTPPVPLKFEAPPAGQQTPDSGACLSPSLALMPAIADVSAAGAPVIAYLRVGGGGAGAATLTLAHYENGAWAGEDISGGVNYTSPQALFTGSAGLITAFDAASGQLKLLRFDSRWVSAGPPETLESVAPGAVLIASDADYDSAAGVLGVVHAYTMGGIARVLYTAWDGQTASSTVVYDGAVAAEIVGGASFRFDAQGGDPWCAFTHGTVDADLANTKFTIATVLTTGRLSGGVWTTADAAYPDSPLAVDLHPAADGHMRLAMTAARNFHLDLSLFGQGTYDLSIQFDGAAGDWNGAGFTFAKPYASNAQFVVVGGFPPTGVGLQLRLATGAVCTGSTGAIYAINNGQINFDLTLTPTDGNLAPGTACYSVNAANTYTTAQFFTGDTGRSFSWQPGGAGSGVQDAAAYLAGTALDSTNLGNLSADALASALEYWSAPASQ